MMGRSLRCCRLIELDMSRRKYESVREAPMNQYLSSDKRALPPQVNLTPTRAMNKRVCQSIRGAGGHLSPACPANTINDKLTQLPIE